MKTVRVVVYVDDTPVLDETAECPESLTGDLLLAIAAQLEEPEDLRK